MLSDAVSSSSPLRCRLQELFAILCDLELLIDFCIFVQKLQNTRSLDSDTGNYFQHLASVDSQSGRSCPQVFDIQSHFHHDIISNSFLIA